ncbi:MAG: hypothetical protein Q9M91_08025 [Candidatus Dojkabacteria bacterium]|nr:hypothetical protein [Candidatus Dojkabacteria bacterium]MDQ7021731.1 hypothetical protein [Candidatus Dojkabacteria bacterium]
MGRDIQFNVDIKSDTNIVIMFEDILFKQQYELVITKDQSLPHPLITISIMSVAEIDRSTIKLPLVNITNRHEKLEIVVSSMKVQYLNYTKGDDVFCLFTIDEDGNYELKSRASEKVNSKFKELLDPTKLELERIHNASGQNYLILGPRNSLLILISQIKYLKQIVG